MRVVMWGTYDTGKPRVRILRAGLRANGIDPIECHADIWSEVADKSGISGFKAKLWFALRWLASYPALIVRYLALPRHDVVLVGYLGQLDVLVLWPFAKLRGATVVWDAFLSLYDTVVEDRKLASPHSLIARTLSCWEWLACRAADLTLLDTRAHADYFVERYRLPGDRVREVFVGAELEFFADAESMRATRRTDGPIRVLFYGQFIPLHGIETIVRAARLAERDEIDWVLIGRGQESERIKAMLDEHPLPRIRWIPWVRYEALREWIRDADVCLGIFGATAKAARVIPNKVFQVLATGSALVTRDSPALRELIGDSTPGVKLVPAADPEALRSALLEWHDLREDLPMTERNRLAQRILPKAIGQRLIEVIEERIGGAA